MNNQQNENFNEIFEIFSQSVINILSKSLDNEICPEIKCNFESFSSINDAEALKNNQALYRIDFATGSRQGNIAVLIPEEFLASASDILTGGKGNDAYKGSLSELETNSVIKILIDLFKDIENKFKTNFNHDLVFSTNAQLILKESENYLLNSGTIFFDFNAKAKIKLNEEQEFQINVLINKTIIDNLMTDLGFSNVACGTKKSTRNNVDINCLSDVEINITAELGRTQVPIKYALELVRGSIVELDTQNNADIKIFANGVEFAYAQVVAIEDNFGLKITKIISPQERLGCVN